MDWIPNELGKKKIVAAYGQERWDMLEALLRAQMAYQNPIAGQLCKDLAEAGGIFDLVDSVSIAAGLGQAIALVRGNMQSNAVPTVLEKAVHLLSLLGLPPHPVTKLPKHTRPIWEDQDGNEMNIVADAPDTLKSGE